MNDNALFTLLRSILTSGFTAQGVALPGSVLQSFQPSRHGGQTGAALYLFKVDSHRYGAPQLGQVYDEDDDVFIETQTQQFETVFQLSAIVPQTDSATELTSADYVELAAAILSSTGTIGTLRAQGVGIMRIADIRNPYFTDDEGENQASPSFDFTITHKKAIVAQKPAAQFVTGGHYQV